MNAAPSIVLEGEAHLPDAPLFGPLELEIAAGQWTCLLGPSGVGKTTILRLVAELETGAHFTGAITASDGYPTASRVAYMAQSDLLMPWASIRQNVAIGRALRGERVDHARVSQLLDRVGLSSMAQRRPHELSGGQRQRAALARTLFEDKPIVLLDEPFSALDARTRTDMQDLTFELLEGRTVLLVTHDPAEAARLGHRILILSEHGLTEVAPPQGAAPRPVDDPETLAALGKLMHLLRAA